MFDSALYESRFKRSAHNTLLRLSRRYGRSLHRRSHVPAAAATAATNRATSTPPTPPKNAPNSSEAGRFRLASDTSRRVSMTPAHAQSPPPPMHLSSLKQTVVETPSLDDSVFISAPAPGTDQGFSAGTNTSISNSQLLQQQVASVDWQGLRCTWFVFVKNGTIITCSNEIINK